MDPRIQIELELSKDPLATDIYPIDTSGLDFIDELLQANRTAPTLQEYREKAIITAVNSPWTLESGLLKY